MTEINKPEKGDIAYAITKAVIGSIPLLGDAATELFGLVITPPLEKRRVEWMNKIAERLNKLEEMKLIEIHSLKDNDQFIDVVLQATAFALKTSEKEK